MNWSALSQNPNAIHLLEQNPDKIDWDYLSRNENAIHLLEQNQDKIWWDYLSLNPNIFEYDYQAMKDHMYGSGICEELMANRFHPDNMHKFAGWGFEGYEPFVLNN